MTPLVDALPTAPFVTWEVNELHAGATPLVLGSPRVDGRPVIGASGVVLGARDGRGALRVRASAVPSRRWPATGTSSELARTRIEGALARHGAEVSWSRASESWWWDGADLRSVWAVDVLVDPGAPSTWRFLVDRTTGEAIHADRTSLDARGRVFPASPFVSRPEVVDLPRLTSPDALVGEYVVARSCDAWTVNEALFGITSCDQSSHHAGPDDAGDYLFPSTPASYADPMAEVGLYFHVDAMSAWLDERFSLRLPYAPIRANVNFPLTNAFYGDFDGDGVPEVSFGTDEGTGTDFGYDADVVYHELGHAVVAQLVPSLPFMGGDHAGMEWAGGSVNEGTADVFSMALTGDPLTGEYAGSALELPAIRDLSWQRRCPDDLRGEVHHDGEVLASFGWALIADERVGPDATALLLVGAVPRYVPDTSWETVGRAFHEAADDLLATSELGVEAHAAVLEHLDASNMEACGRVIPLDDGLRPDLYLVTGGLQGELERLPAGNGLSIRVPEGARGVSIRVSDFVGVPGMGWAVYGRVGESVGHEYTEVPGLGLGFAVPTRWDWVVDGEGEEGSIAVGVGEIPLVPGETLYLSVASRNLGTLLPFDFQYGKLTLGADLAPALPEPPPVTPGCDVGSTGAGALASGLALLATLLRRRGPRAGPVDKSWRSRRDDEVARGRRYIEATAATRATTAATPSTARAPRTTARPVERVGTGFGSG